MKTWEQPMDLIRIDTQRAYELIREKITSLDLSPGSSIDEGKLAKELKMGLVPVREALNLLAYDHLVETAAQCLFVSKVSIPDLQQISEIRILLEPYCAQQAAVHATADDLVVLEALSQDQSQIPPDRPKQLFDLDHKFHQAIARAAKNKYLEEILEDFYGHSKRAWFLVLPHLDFLSTAVESHLDMVQAIKAQDSEGAAQMMREHVQGFYEKVFEILRTTSE
jgi:DNA-binding GntR family transcriptional regulator